MVEQEDAAEIVHQSKHYKKRSAKKADFLSKGESFTSDNNMNQSHASSKQSIIDSVRNQSRQMTPKHANSGVSSDRAKTEHTVS